MVPLGMALAPPSSLLIRKSGAPAKLVESLPVLLDGLRSEPLAPSSEMTAVLLMLVVPTGSGLLTFTAKMAEPDPPPLPASVPRFRVQVDPALPSGLQSQPPVLAVALNVVA